MTPSITYALAGVSSELHLVSFVCGGWHFSWPYECLDSRRTGSQCLLGHLAVPIDTHNKSEASHWSTPLNLHRRLKWEHPGGVLLCDSQFSYIQKAFNSWVGLS